MTPTLATSLAELNQQAVVLCSAGQFAEAFALVESHPEFAAGGAGGMDEKDERDERDEKDEKDESGEQDQAAARADALNIAGACSFALHEFDQAERYWRDCLRLKPDYAEVIDSLGMLFKSLGRLSAAKALYRQLVTLRPEAPEAHSRLGAVLVELGYLDDAEASYRAAITLRPDFAEAHYNRATTLQNLGRFAEAEHAYRAALRGLPNHAEAHNNLGNVLLAMGRPADADAAYREALTLRPQYPEALNNLSNVLKMAGRLAEAELAHRLALAIRPGYAEAHVSLGTTLDALGRIVEAEAAYREALTLRPDYAEAHYNLGIALFKLDRFGDAEAAYRNTIRLRPDIVHAYNNLGCVLRLVDRIAESVDVFSQAAAICPDMAEAHYNLGASLAQLGRLSASESAYRRALALRPAYIEARFGLAVLMLGMGNYEEGWQQYECRYEHLEFVHYKTRSMLACAHWTGDALAGRSLLVWQEDGLGDMLQFSRYFALLKAQGASRITFACMPALHRLMKNVDGIDAVVDHDTAMAQAASFDCWTSLLSAPMHLRTTLDTIPRPVRLAVDGALIDRWQPAIDALPPGLKVGLVWKGNPKHHNDANRSIPWLTQLAPLWSVPGVSFVSLQKGQGEDEAREEHTDQPLVELGTQVTDLADTAAIVAQLDLVICVDTSIAHLAGSLGKPCWVMLPAKDVDWRWLQERSDSPWYPPTLRVFRRAPGEGWPASIERVRQALAAKAGL